MTPQILLQFRLHRHHDQVAVTVGTCCRKCSGLGSVDAGLESPSKSWSKRDISVVVKLVVKHKIVAAVSEAEVANGRRWEKCTYLRSVNEQTATAEYENGIRALLDAAQPS